MKGYKQTYFTQYGDSGWFPLITYNTLIEAAKLFAIISALCIEGKSKFADIGTKPKCTFMLSPELLKQSEQQTFEVHVQVKIILHDMQEMPDELPF